MSNRKRNFQLSIRLTQEEKNLFLQKMQLTSSKSISHFIRKCVLEKEIYEIDCTPFLDLAWEISKIGTNINQLTKKANALSKIELEDIEKIKKDISSIGKKVSMLQEILYKRRDKAAERHAEF
jgi:hypothetical protein